MDLGATPNPLRHVWGILTLLMDLRGVLNPLIDCFEILNFLWVWGVILFIVPTPIRKGRHFDSFHGEVRRPLIRSSHGSLNKLGRSTLVICWGILNPLIDFGESLIR